MFFLSAILSSPCCQFREQHHLPLLRLSQIISAQYTAWTYLSMSFGRFVEQPVYFKSTVSSHILIWNKPLCVPSNVHISVCLFIYMLLKYTAPFPSFWGICFLIVFAKAPIPPQSIILKNVLHKAKNIKKYGRHMRS